VLYRQADRARTCGIVISGAGGEHFGYYPWMQEFARAGRTRVVNYDNLIHMRVLLPMGAPDLLRREPSDEVESYAREMLARRAEPLRGELNTTQLDLLYAYKSVGHFGAFRSAFESRLRTETPFYYRDIFSAAFSAHHRWRNGHRLHRALIERLHPRVSAVATERGGPAQLARANNLVRFLPYYAALGRTAVRKLRRRPSAGLPLSNVVLRGYGHAVRSLRDGLLTPGEMRSAALYQPQPLENLVRASATPGFTDWELLGRVLTLELVLRKVPDAAL